MDGFRVGLSMRWSRLLAKRIACREYKFLEGRRRYNCLHGKTAMERAGE